MFILFYLNEMHSNPKIEHQSLKTLILEIQINVCDAMWNSFTLLAILHMPENTLKLGQKAAKWN